jgi:hypothetical protein
MNRGERGAKGSCAHDQPCLKRNTESSWVRTGQGRVRSRPFASTFIDAGFSTATPGEKLHVAKVARMPPRQLRQALSRNLCPRRVLQRGNPTWISGAESGKPFRHAASGSRSARRDPRSSTTCTSLRERSAFPATQGARNPGRCAEGPVGKCRNTGSVRITGSAASIRTSRSDVCRVQMSLPVANRKTLCGKRRQHPHRPCG